MIKWEPELELCPAVADLGAGVVVECARFADHPLPHEAPIVLEHHSVLTVLGRVQWPHTAASPRPATAATPRRPA